MPLIKSRSEKAQKKNLVELSVGQVGKSRHKAIGTYMKRKGIGYEEARRKLSYIISKRIQNV